MAMNDHTDLNTRPAVRIGWGEADITPQQPVLLAGMHQTRLSEGVGSPLTATVLALDSGEDQVVFVSCDLVSISNDLREALQACLADWREGPDPGRIVLNATHTHNGPVISSKSPAVDHLDGGKSGMNLQAMPIVQYVSFAAARIAQAVREAWAIRAPGGIAYGLGSAAISNNRRWVNMDGAAAMGFVAPAISDTFRHVEGYEDHGVNVIATYDAQDALTGLVVNVACPSQTEMSGFVVSADWWHEVRRSLRQRYGERLFVLPQCSAAGDQESYLRYELQAKQRMLILQGRTVRDEIAHRIVTAVADILPCMSGTIERTPLLRHEALAMDLPVNRVTEQDARKAGEAAEAWRADFEQAQREAQLNSQRDPHWYVKPTYQYGRMHWNLRVVHRYAQQTVDPCYPIELHVLRIGDVAIATSPFEVYLDFGMQMKLRSPATQTFLVQLAGKGSYLPSPRSISGGGYGSVPASNLVGPEGGQIMVDHTVAALRRLWGIS